jgi:hypothetical protein
MQFNTLSSSSLCGKAVVHGPREFSRGLLSQPHSGRRIREMQALNRLFDEAPGGRNSPEPEGAIDLCAHRSGTGRHQDSTESAQFSWRLEMVCRDRCQGVGRKLPIPRAVLVSGAR